MFQPSGGVRASKHANFIKAQSVGATDAGFHPPLDDDRMAANHRRDGDADGDADGGGGGAADAPSYRLD